MMSLFEDVVRKPLENVDVAPVTSMPPLSKVKVRPGPLMVTSAPPSRRKELTSNGPSTTELAAKVTFGLMPTT